MIRDLAKAVREQSAILFVGAGVSRNLGLPSFKGLVTHLAQELNYDPEIYDTHGDYLALAEYYYLEKGSIGSLRSWMDRAWHQGIDVKKSEIHKLIVDLNFPIIYTTNYDTWLERAFDEYKKPYTKITNVGDLAKVKQDVTQIVKFHGDFEDDSSIVLAETSYFERLSFESPLDVKLRADLLGKSVLFIGYQLRDINIRYMLFRLHRQWELARAADARPQSYVFLARPNPVQERIFSSRGVSSIVSEVDDPGEGLRQFLQQLLNFAYGRVGDSD